MVPTRTPCAVTGGKARGKLAEDCTKSKQAYKRLPVGDNNENIWLGIRSHTAGADKRVQAYANAGDAHKSISKY